MSWLVFLCGTWFVREAIEQGELWRLGTCLVLHGGLTHLALDTFFLGWMGPGESDGGSRRTPLSELVMHESSAGAAVLWSNTLLRWLLQMLVSALCGPRGAGYAALCAYKARGHDNLLPTGEIVCYTCILLQEGSPACHFYCRHKVAADMPADWPRGKKVGPTAASAALRSSFAAAGIEALLGHSVFMYVYLFSGLAGSAAVTLLSDPSTPVAGATAATVGLVGAMVGYELRNVEVVKQSLKSRLSKAEDGKHGSSTLRKPWGAFGIVCLVLLLGGVPNSMMDNAAHAAGLLAGLGLGYFMGPSFTVVQVGHRVLAG
jgi:membrane associated rhomboid family serine protease